MRQQVAASIVSERAAGFPRGGPAGPVGSQPAANSGLVLSRGAAARAESRHRHSVLARAIETLVIPRMVQAHRDSAATGFAAASSSGVLTTESVQEFARLILTNEVPTATACLAAMRARGAALETLYLDLLAPVARYLGELWKEDLCDFTQVTTGLWRLQQVLREFGASFHHEVVNLDPSRHALLVPAPGEQHTFGLVMVAEFFRRAGWGVWSGTPESMSDLLAMVRGEWFAVVGFSVACGNRLEALAAGIRQVRRASRNRRIGIMVGGPLFAEQPNLVSEVGADATASDGRQAVLNAAALLDRLTDAELAACPPAGRT